MLRLIDCWDLTPSHADAKVRTKYTGDELLRGAEKRFDYPLSILSIKKYSKRIGTGKRRIQTSSAEHVSSKLKVLCVIFDIFDG